MRPDPRVKHISVVENDALHLENPPLIISATRISTPFGQVKLTVGSRGLPNLKSELSVGDFVVFDLPGHGTFEVRLVKVGYAPYPYPSADLSIAPLSFSVQKSDLESSLPDIDDTKPEAHSPFTAEEKAQIRKAIEKFHEDIRDMYHPTTQQDSAIVQDLKHLSEMLDRLQHKVDWKGIAISTLMNISATLTLSPESLRALAALLLAALKLPLGLP